MTRRRWLLAIMAIMLIGAATPILLMLLPCKSRAVVLLNASRWAAEVTVQIVTSETGPRYTLWSGIIESHAPPLLIPVAEPGRDAHYSLTLHFPETSQSNPDFEFGYISGYLKGVEFLLIRDEDIIHAFWHDPPRTKEPMGLLSNLWDAAIRVPSHMSCVDG